jgi:hypothetical protein
MLIGTRYRDGRKGGGTKKKPTKEKESAKSISEEGEMP